MIDTVWTVMVTGVVIGAVILIIEYWTPWFNIRRKKELSYEIVSSAPVVTRAEDASLNSALIILYKGESVLNVWSIVIRITNTGNVEIARDDYDKPLEIRCLDNDFILDHLVLATIPDDLDVVAVRTEERFAGPTSKPGIHRFRHQALEIKPILLNKGDVVTFSLLLGDYNQHEPKLTGRIVGGALRKISSVRPTRSDRLRIFLTIQVAIILAFVSFLILSLIMR